MAGLGGRAWILIALAAFIVIMLIAVIAINVVDGPAASSSPDVPATSATASAHI